MASSTRALCLLVLSLALCQAATAQTATVTVGTFDNLSSLSSDLNTLTASINVVNVLFNGPKVGQGLANIANSIYAAMNNFDNPPPVFGDSDAVAVVNALKTFVTVHQRLLNTVIGKHGILSLFFFAEPVRVALVSLEAAVDAFALALIDMIPTQAPAANGQFGSLSVTVTSAINVYS